MPIYEFYCEKCNTLYSFFSKRINTDKIPFCPRCKTIKLQRQMSIFAKISGNRKETDNDFPPIDEARMEKAMEMLTREADSIDEDDPRQAAQMMRKLTEATGLDLSSGMEEALSRLEKGEDPEQIEAEMGDILENEDPFVLTGKGKKSGRRTKPIVDETLYDL